MSSEQNNLPNSSYLPNSPTTSLNWKSVAGYVLQEKLGSGSFAIVYKGVKLESANDPNPPLENIAAIKAIARNSDKLTPKLLHNLEKEISILRKYRHRNIVCLHEAQRTSNHFYLILEFCAGGDLQHLIRERKTGRLTEPLCRRLMRDLCGGLQFLHRHQLIHRDIKPQNLLLTGALPLDEINDVAKTEELESIRQKINFSSDRFVLKIADFGFARHLQTTSLAETLCGSPLYMAPEILSHQRYDEKADLWSVGTVLFEMITGVPPFNGDNHIHLLRNIQKNGVKLPPGVRISKECINLLRILLNRNPLNRANASEFATACNAFVALGCNGNAALDEINTSNDETNVFNTSQPRQTLSESSMAMETPEENNFSKQQDNSSIPAQAVAAPHYNAISTPSQPMTISSLSLNTKLQIPETNIVSHMTMKSHDQSVTDFNHSSGRGNVFTIPEHSLELVTRTKSSPAHSDAQGGMEALGRIESQGNLQSSTDDFVMVEHGSSVHRTNDSGVEGGIVSVNDNYYTNTKEASRYRLQQSPPSSPGFLFRKAANALTGPPAEYIMPKHNHGYRGMLSTSPGTGGALMGLLMGRATNTGLLHDSPDTNRTEKQTDERILVAVKMLAASEDVGRRAVSVAHLGDNRAVLGIKLRMMMNADSSSMLSVTPMEGIDEEDTGNPGGMYQQCSGAVSDDSGCTEIMGPARYRRQRSMSAADRYMDTKADFETDSMPFALTSDSQPLISAAIPTRSGTASNKASIMNKSRQVLKPSSSTVRAHFSEALLCYVKALKMLKGSFAAVEGISKEVNNLLLLPSPQMLSADQRSHLEQVGERCEVSKNWLGTQFNGVLERGDAADVEIRKIPLPAPIPSTEASSGNNNPCHLVPAVSSVEELIYSQSLALGREGAVKQLLGQNEQARACFRSAGLLAETLLMDSNNVVGEDRKLLEGYVDAFATQISELDTLLQQQLSQSRAFASGAGFVSTNGSMMRQQYQQQP